ncbi:MAG: aldehyde ferredoxin oxidoreductase C-terminal domain-containing protein [Desulfomicrobium escambiense]|nr:aldehyde ferredoxin oxidoreductase C-terminal domain-containing protein [Desulfomicrobium escambiense]
MKAYEEGRTACAGCVVPCKDVFRIPSGPYAGEVGKAMEHECLHCLGTNCGVTDPVAIMTMENLADKYGMCVIGLGNAIALAKDLFAHGLIGPTETEGLDHFLGKRGRPGRIDPQGRPPAGLREPRRRGVAELRPDRRRQGDGLLLPRQGLSRGHHPAGIFALAHATSTRGADHLRGRSWAFGENDPEIWPMLIREGFIPVSTR